MSDPEDRPTRAEAEADMRDDRTQLEKLMDLNAYVSRNEHDDGRVTHCVSIGYPTRQSTSVPSLEVGRALSTVINLTSPADLSLIISTLVRAYGEKCVALEHYVPEEWDEEDGDEADDYEYDPF